MRRRQLLVRRRIFFAVLVAACLVIAAGVWRYNCCGRQAGFNSAAVQRQSSAKDFSNPLSGRKFYVDNTRAITKLAAEYRKNDNTADAQALNRVAEQPGAIWLTGPSPGDPTANRDIQTVKRTSSEAARQGTLPAYQLYALPGRDACAAHSKGGFTTENDYLKWVKRIQQALKTDAIISLEADSIAHTINSDCLKTDQIEARYALLKKAVLELKTSPRVIGIYLDAGQPDWLPDPYALVEPLRKSGIEHARGIAANVSFFAETSAVTAWSQQLVQHLGGDKGVIIDTSRNGRGIAQLQGDARWCNPPGRGAGSAPTTQVQAQNIDAYFWAKTIGESDGACSGRPAAGVFVPEIALELARNARL